MQTILHWVQNSLIKKLNLKKVLNSFYYLYHVIGLTLSSGVGNRTIASQQQKRVIVHAKASLCGAIFIYIFPNLYSQHIIHQRATIRHYTNINYLPTPIPRMQTNTTQHLCSYHQRTHQTLINNYLHYI